MESKKLKYTLLVSGALMGAAAFTTITAATTPTAYADATTTVTSPTPSSQTVNTSGVNDNVDAIGSGALAGSYTNVGNRSKVLATSGYDTATSAYTAATEIAVMEADSADSSQQVIPTDATTLFSGDSSHYLEKQADGTWQINSVTLQGGTATAGNDEFSADVSNLYYLSGSDIQSDYALTDGVNVQISSNYTSASDAASYPDLPSGLSFFVQFYGLNMQDDINQTQETDASDVAEQDAYAYINSPITFHYFKDGVLRTGTLNLTNGAATPASSAAAASSASDSSSSTTTSSAATTSSATDSTSTAAASSAADTSSAAESGTPGDTPANQVGGSAASAATDPVQVSTSQAGAAATVTPVSTTSAAQATTPSSTATTSKAKTLPQTDEKTSLSLLASLLGVFGFGFAASRKRNF